MPLGGKNWLFAGSDAGGERASAMYSLIGSAKLNGIDAMTYLRFVLERIADQPNQPDRRAASVEGRCCTRSTQEQLAV